MEVALPILRATVEPPYYDGSTTNHNESNENPTSIPFGRLQHRKSHAITNPTP